MSRSDQTLYDVITYPSHPYDYAHPDRLHVIATLFGLQAPPVTTARVLELGCGGGGNLIPMAARLPDAEFVGIDLAPTAVDEARATIAELGLTNIEVFQADIAALPSDMGTFDFIIAHGVFSWIPEPVRLALLDAVSRMLTDHGVAYVSYNTYPGWHLHNTARQLMRMHAARFDDPVEQIGQSAGLVAWFAEHLTSSDAPYAAVIAGERDLLDKHTAGYLFHDFLAPINQPYLLTEFVALAEERGLVYLGDTAFGTMMPDSLPAAARELVEGISPDLVALEQYMDFLRGTGFRRSLLMREGNVPNRQIKGASIAELYVSMRGKVASQAVDVTTEEPVEFEVGEHGKIAISSPLGKAALMRLVSMAPGEVTVRELVGLACDWLQRTATPEDLTDLGGALVRAFGAGLVELSPRHPGHTHVVSERPLADPLVRHQAMQDLGYICNRRHERVTVGRFDKALLAHADGTRDLAGLVDACVAEVEAGRLEVRLDDVATDREEVIRASLQDAVPGQLAWLVRTALLVG